MALEVTNEIVSVVVGAGEGLKITNEAIFVVVDTSQPVDPVEETPPYGLLPLMVNRRKVTE